jgi:hypothetical protein
MIVTLDNDVAGHSPFQTGVNALIVPAIHAF